MRSTTTAVAATAAAALVLGACSPTTDEEPEASASAAAVCEPVAGEALVVLADDLLLQNSDNIIPAINAETALDPAVGAALDEVSLVLDTETLIGLNKRTDIDFETSVDVAKDFVASNEISAPFESGGDIVVGAFNFSESITLAEIYGEVLRDAGFTVEVRTVGNRETVMPALISGELDVVPEYAATAAEFLNRSANGAEAEAVASVDIDETTVALYALGNDAGVTFGRAAAAQDQNAFATTQAFADQYGVTTLSELAEVCGEGISLGGPAECPERTFCQIGLEETYGLTITQFNTYDVGGPLTKAALTQGEVILGLVFSSDGALG